MGATLEDELDHVKLEIVRMISEKRNAGREGESAKQFQVNNHKILLF